MRAKNRLKQQNTAEGRNTADKPQITGQLSLAVPPWVSATNTSECWDANRYTARRTIAACPWSRSVIWCLAEGYGNEDQRSRMGLIWLGKDFYVFMYHCKMSQTTFISSCARPEYNNEDMVACLHAACNQFSLLYSCMCRPKRQNVAL